jgi:hypothetical protein
MMPLLEESPPPGPAPERPPCAYQGCDRRAEACPVVSLPPPAVARNGQPLRIVFRRSPVCDRHRHEIVAHLRPRLRASLAAYCARRALPPPEWEVATWEYEPLEGP